MKSKYFKLVVNCLTLFLSIVTCASQGKVDTIFNNSPLVKGDYFSESKPGSTPVVFAPYLLNSKIHHLHSAPVFTPDGEEMYFSVYVNNELPQKIFFTKQNGSVWQKPKIAPFSGTYQDGGPVLSPDGNTLYYYSKRPDIEGQDQLAKSRIRYVKKENGIWGKSQLLEFPSDLGISFYPSFLSTNNTLYFFVEDKNKDYDIFQCNIINDKPVDIVKVGNPISVLGSRESGAISDPQNKVLIFSSYNRYNNKKMRLFYSVKNDDGYWREPKLFKENAILADSRFVSFTPDGKYFFFLSYKEGYEQIYWVSSKIIFDEINNGYNKK